MLLKTEMGPFPVSAVEKFREAVCFFNRMIETQTNVYFLPYNLSAFLLALRSVTFYLQERYGKDASFQQWYVQKQDEMRNDPLLRMLKDMRDEVLHARPIQLQCLQGPTLPEEGIITTHLEISATTDEQGEIRVAMKVGLEGEERDVPRVVKWVVDLPDEIDILQASGNGLCRIRDLLQEWQQISGRAA
jgi:hypothetical protein